MRLGDIIDLKPGIEDRAEYRPGRRRCASAAASVPMFEGKIGRRKNRIAVRIERELVRPQQGERS